MAGEKRVWWSNWENKVLLEIIGSMDVVRALVCKRQKNADIFKAVEKRMRDRGFQKTWEQIRSRWKRMKSEYIREKRHQEKTNKPAMNGTFFQQMTRVLGEYAPSVESPIAWVEGVDVIEGDDCSDNGGEEVKVHVELVEGEGVIENNFPMTEDADIEEIKTEPPASPSSEEDPICTTDQDNEPEGKKRRSSPPDNTLKMFADEYARKHVLYVREWQSQYQDWFERQMEAQQQYEETLMREQMELTKSMLESVTATFLQGIQQVLQNVVANVGRRPMTPFCPTAAMNFDFNSHNSPHAGLSTFMESQSSASNSRTFVQNQTANCTADKHCVGNQA